jgi:putative toxin-antitoxin system antitoxin component (TIGR02293 family)
LILTIWGATLDQVVWNADMLTNYDARAVAGVLGIAFLDDSKIRPTKGTGSGRTARRVEAVEVDALPKLIAGTRNKLVRTVDAGTMQQPSPVLIEEAVEKGLPRHALRHVAEQIAGADKARIASLEWSIVPKTTLERRTDQLSPLESERTERVARLFVHARRALGTEAEARDFMMAPHPQLDGRTPVDAAKTDLSTRRAEQILNALEYGLAL